MLRCRRGDADAWRELVRTWERRLLYYLRRLLNDERDAWDALQQTWLDAFRNLKTLKNPRALRPWIYQIAHRRAISLRRKCGSEVPLASSGDDDPAIDQIPDSSWLDEQSLLEHAEEAHCALGRLSLPHREVITLFFLEAMPIEEIAQVLGTPAGTVKSRLHYAKNALKEALQRAEMS